MRKPACVGQREKAVPSGPLATPSFPARPQCAELPLAGESVSECPVVQWGPAHKSRGRLTQRACWVKVGQGQGRWEVPKAALEAGAIARFPGTVLYVLREDGIPDFAGLAGAPSGPWVLKLIHTLFSSSPAARFSLFPPHILSLPSFTSLWEEAL